MNKKIKYRGKTATVLDKWQDGSGRTRYHIQIRGEWFSRSVTEKELKCQKKK